MQPRLQPPQRRRRRAGPARRRVAVATSRRGRSASIAASVAVQRIGQPASAGAPDRARRRTPAPARARSGAAAPASASVATCVSRPLGAQRRRPPARRFGELRERRPVMPPAAAPARRAGRGPCRRPAGAFVQLQAPAVGLGDRGDQRQAEAGARRVAAVLQAHEALHHPLAVLLRHAGAGVGDRELDLAGRRGGATRSITAPPPACISPRCPAGWPAPGR